jgi:chitosanase
MIRKRSHLVAAGAAALVASGAIVAGITSANADGSVTASLSRNSWDTGYTATYTIANGTSKPINSWTVEFDLPPGTTLGAYWDALLTTSGNHVVARNREYNGTVGVSGSTSFGFNAQGTGVPVNCTINGAPCGGGGAPPTAPPTTPPPTTIPPTTAPPTTPPATPPATKPPTTPPATRPPAGADLNDPRKKDIAMQLVSSAENSSLDWRAQFGYIEDIGDGRGYTAGIIGFCSGTHDMLELVDYYTLQKPNNILARYLPALRNVDGTDSHAGLDPNFPADWKAAAKDPAFQAAQEHERDRVYFDPAVSLAKQDGLPALGQFAYYDAAVMHGPGAVRDIRSRAQRKAGTPAQGGDVVAYLNAFLDERVIEMKKEAAHEDTSRVDTAQRKFLNERNLDLNPPLSWKVYGEPYSINS